MLRLRGIFILALLGGFPAYADEPEVFEVEAFQMALSAQASNEYGYPSVVFSGGEQRAEAGGTVTLARDHTGFWVHLYFDGANAVIGDANSVCLSLDGADETALASESKNRWLWARVNAPLKAGRHTVVFRRREAPVYLDCIAFCEGPDAREVLARLRPPKPFRLPFDLENDLLLTEAPSFGQWNAFGSRQSNPRIGMPEREAGSGTPLLKLESAGAAVVWLKEPTRVPSDMNWLDRPTCVELVLRTGSRVEVSCIVRDFKGNYALQPMAESGQDGAGRHFASLLGWTEGVRTARGSELEPPLALQGLRIAPADGAPMDATVVEMGLTNPFELRAATPWQVEKAQDAERVMGRAEVLNRSTRKWSLPLRAFHCGAADAYRMANETALAPGAGEVKWVEVGAGERATCDVRLDLKGDGFYGASIGMGTPIGCLVAGGAVVPWEPGPPGRPALTNISHCPTGFGVPGPPPCVLGNYLYLAGGEGDMTVLDVTDKRNPRIASITHTWFFWHRIFPFRNRLFFRPSRSDGVFFFDDGADPYHPGVIRQSGLSGVPVWMDEETSVAITQGQDGLVMWDMTDLYEPSQKSVLQGIGGFCKLPGKPVAVGMTDGTRKLAVLGIKPGGALEVLCKLDNEYDKEGQPAEIAAANARLVLLRRGDHLIAYDLEDPQHPVRRFDGPLAVEAPSFIRGMTVEGDTLYLSDARYLASGHWVSHNSSPSALYAFDLSPIYTARAVPVPETAKPVSGKELEPALVGGRQADEGEQFVESVETEGCLKAIPRLWHVVETLPTYYGSITVHDGYLYVSDYDFGIHIYKLNGKEPPEKVGKHITAGEGHFGTLLGDYYCLAQTFGGSVTVIDVSDLKNPRRRGYFWDGEFTVYKLAGRGTALYVPKDGGRVKVVDISDPDNPREVGMFPVEGTARGGTRVTTLGDRAFVITCTDIGGTAATRIFQYDIATPLQPRLIRTFELPGPARGFTPQICARPGVIHVMDAQNHRFHILSVADDGSMALRATLEGVFVSTHYNMEYPGALTESRGYVYVAGVDALVKDPKDGKLTAPSPQRFHIIDVRDLSQPRLVSTADPKARVVDWANLICDMESSDDFLVVGNYGSLLVYDIRENPAQPRYLSGIPTAYNWTIGVLKDRLIYSCGLNGLYVLRIWP